MPATKPNVFNIPASAPFLPTLIDALRDGRLVPGFPAGAIRSSWRAPRSTCRRGAPAGSRATFSSIGSTAMPPSCRASSRSAISTRTRSPSPKPRPANWPTPRSTLPPAFAPLERRLTLAELISKWAAAITPDKGTPLIANTPEAAVALADALARLMDDMITRQVPWENLDRAGARRARRILAAIARSSCNSCIRQWRKILRREEGHRSRRAPRQADRGRGQAPRRLRRAGDRRRFDRLDAGDRQAARHHRQDCRTAPWCCPASTWRSTMPPGR